MTDALRARRPRVRQLWRGLCAAAAAGCFAAPAAALSPVTDFELSRYAGDWYEIASIPTSFRSKCARDTQAQYTPGENGVLIVHTRCVTVDGAVESSEGRGRLLDPDVPAVLKVTFVYQLGIWWYPFGRNQVVIANAPDYQWLVIAEPSLTYGRIMSRQPAMSSGALRAAAAALVAEQYDLCAFTFKPQAGGRGQTSRLCDEMR